MAYPGSAFSPQPNRRLSVGFASATQPRSNLITCIYSNVLPTWLLEVDASGSSLLLRGFVRRMRGIPARAEPRSGTPHMYILKILLPSHDCNCNNGFRVCARFSPS